VIFMGVIFELEQRQARERSVENLESVTAPDPQVV
jgi:hypothetical protein